MNRRGRMQYAPTKKRHLKDEVLRERRINSTIIKLSFSATDNIPGAWLRLRSAIEPHAALFPERSRRQIFLRKLAKLVNTIRMFYSE
jgi:hypothetical protein